MNTNCLNCGGLLKAKRATKKYCSNNCKQLAYFKRTGMIFGVSHQNVNEFIVKPDAIANVKKELDVKYDSLYSRQELTQNTAKMEEEVLLCRPLPFVRITEATKGINVKSDIEFIVKPDAKEQEEVLTYNTEANVKEETLTENTTSASDEKEDLELIEEATDTPESKPKEEEKTEREPKYEWVESCFLNEITKHSENSNERFGFRENQNPGKHWVNIRLRCLIESLIKLSGFSEIDQDTLLKVTQAFNLLVNSKVFNELSFSYPYSEIALELAEKLNALALAYQHNDKIQLRLTFKKKARLVWIREEMKDFTPQVKLSETNFSETHIADSINGRLSGIIAQNKKSGLSFEERYKKYVEAGLIEPDEDGDKVKRKTEYKSEPNPYFERLLIFKRTGKFPEKPFKKHNQN